MRNRSFVFFVLLLASTTAVAAGSSGSSADNANANPMSGWRPPKLSHEAQDKQEIAAVFRKMEEAGKKGDLSAATALVDFPVLMATDDSKGEAMAGPWNEEEWTKAMKPFYAKPMDMKVTHKQTIHVLTDSLATAVDQATFAMGGKKMTTRSSSLLVRKGGQWKIKSLVEGGWGDAMGAAQSAGAEPSTGAGAGESGQKQKQQ